MRGRSDKFTTEEVLEGIDAGATEWKAAHPGKAFRFIDYRVWADAELL